MAAHRVVLGMRVLHPRLHAVRRRERVLVQALRVRKQGTSAGDLPISIRVDTLHTGGLPGHVPGDQFGTARGEQAVGVVSGEGRVPRVLVLLRRRDGIQRVVHGTSRDV